MEFDFHDRPGIGAGQPRHLAAGEPAILVAVEPACRERVIGGDTVDRAAAFVGRRGEIDGAAGIAEVGVARALVKSAALLVERMRKAPHLGRERVEPPRNLPDRTAEHDVAVIHIGPVDQEQREGCIVVEARGQIGFVQMVALQRSRDVHRVDVERERLRDGRRRHAGKPLVSHTVERQVLIVVGESDLHAIGPLQQPAMAKCGEPACEFVSHRG